MGPLPNGRALWLINGGYLLTTYVRPGMILQVPPKFRSPRETPGHRNNQTPQLITLSWTTQQSSHPSGPEAKSNLEFTTNCLRCHFRHFSVGFFGGGFFLRSSWAGENLGLLFFLFIPINYPGKRPQTVFKRMFIKIIKISNQINNV